MNDKLAKEYIIKLLEYQEVKLKCVNLGYTRDKDIKIELEIIEYCIDYMKRRWNHENTKIHTISYARVN